MQVVKVLGPTLDRMRPEVLIIMLRIFWLSDITDFTRSSQKIIVPLFMSFR